MRPAWRMIADEQPVRAVGQREEWGQMSNAYEMKFSEKNEAKRATHTRCRPARKMTADEERLQDVSQQGE